jgi:FKBP-type peptidyl-prolyl cis-trans isomerase FkpA
MMRNLFPFAVLFLISLVSCETTNPFDRGPEYDAAGNLEIDRKKIAGYLDTAKIDSLYRIHDPSGVVVIVQREGVGSRPTSNTVVYTDYTGKLMEQGTVFDTSSESIARANNVFVEGRVYKPFSFVLGAGGIINGWDIGFRKLRPASKAVFIIPSTEGYRSQNNNDKIPPNSVLVFQLDFLGID